MWGIPIFKELAQLFLKHYVGQQSLPVGCQFACSVLDRVIVPHCICLSFPANSLSPCLPVTAALSKLWHELRKTHTYLWPCDSHLAGTSGPVTQLGRSYSSQHAPSARGTLSPRELFLLPYLTQIPSLQGPCLLDSQGSRMRWECPLSPQSSSCPKWTDMALGN